MAQQPNPWKSLSDAIAKIREDVKRLQNRSPFFGTGMHPTANDGMQSDDFDGNLDTNDAGSMGWAMNSAKAAFGQLILRPGSIGNDALTNPVSPGSLSGQATNFGVGTSYSTIVSLTVTVPTGFTGAALTVTGRVFIYDPNTTGGADGAGADYAYARLSIAGTTGNGLPILMGGNGGSALNPTALSVVLTGLTPGSTFAVHLDASSGFQSIAANVSNLADLSGSVMWFR